MNPVDLETIEAALVNPTISEEAAVSAIEALSALRRRDWSVRVIDAAEDLGWQFVWVTGALRFALLVTRPDMATLGAETVGGAFEGATKEAARHAAALAVFPALDAATRADLGECP